MGLPDGAKVTDSDSTISTYSSLEVCRIPGRLQGIAGAFPALGVGTEANEDFSEFEDPGVAPDL